MYVYCICIETRLPVISDFANQYSVRVEKWDCTHQVSTSIHT